MGWQSRERESNVGLEVRYRVRRWTALSPLSPDAPDRRTAKATRRVHLDNSAAMMRRRLQREVPEMHADVQRVTVDRQDQLCFELTVLAADEEEARRSAEYRIKRALSVKAPSGEAVLFGRKPTRIMLRPPWGRTEVVVVRAVRGHAHA